MHDFTYRAKKAVVSQNNAISAILRQNQKKVPPGQEFHISPGGTVVRRSLADYETFVRGNITFNVERIQYRMFAVL